MIRKRYPRIHTKYYTTPSHFTYRYLWLANEYPGTPRIGIERVVPDRKQRGWQLQSAFLSDNLLHRLEGYLQKIAWILMIFLASAMTKRHNLMQYSCFIEIWLCGWHSKPQKWRKIKNIMKLTDVSLCVKTVTAVTGTTPFNIVLRTML